MRVCEYLAVAEGLPTALTGTGATTGSDLGGEGSVRGGGGYEEANK